MLIAPGRGPAGDRRRPGPRRPRPTPTSWPPIVAGAIAANPDAAAKIRAGNGKAIGAIIGQVMRETKGRADGGEVTRLVHEQLGA